MCLCIRFVQLWKAVAMMKLPLDFSQKTVRGRSLVRHQRLRPASSRGKAVDLFLKYAAKHKDQLYGPASRIIAEALKEAHLCEAKK
jgi:hypothetical protein